MKVAAIGDIHYARDSRGRLRELLQGLEGAEALVLAGDLTNLGKPEELEVFVEELHAIETPVLAVAGNHDYEGGQIAVLTEMLRGAGVTVLDGTSHRIGDVDFVGTKGFCGGFGRARVQPFGEPALKTFIMAGVEETLRFEAAVKACEGPRVVAVLHYAPIKATLAGEDPELFPFLGCSMFEEVLDTYEVDVAFHAHAHNGSLVGQTKGGIPVHNVSRFVRAKAGLPPLLVIDV